jgi:hypothetical protein
MIIKNPIYFFLSLQINLGIVFTLKVRNFQFNGVQVPCKFTFLLALFSPNLIPWPTDAKS